SRSDEQQMRETSATPADAKGASLPSDPIIAAHNRRVAGAARVSGLQRVILSILTETPDATAKEVEDRLRRSTHIAGYGIVVTASDRIEWTLGKVTRTAPMSGLKDRVTRAKRNLK